MWYAGKEGHGTNLRNVTWNASPEKNHEGLSGCLQKNEPVPFKNIGVWKI